jgi:hypothetical protein
MENNPYQTPESNIRTEGDFKRSLWWKITFFFITILSAFGIVSFFDEPGTGISEYISIVIWLLATISFFGFVFFQPIYKPKFWLQVLIASVIFSVLYYFITDVDLRMGLNDTEYYISDAIGWILSFSGCYIYNR